MEANKSCAALSHGGWAPSPISMDILQYCLASVISDGQSRNERAVPR